MSSSVVFADSNADAATSKAKKRNLVSCPTPPSRKAKRLPKPGSDASSSSWAAVTESVLTLKCLCTCPDRDAALVSGNGDLLDSLSGLEACISLLKRQKTAGFLCSSLAEFVETFLTEAEDPPEESLVVLALTSEDAFVSYAASRAALALIRFKKSYALTSFHRILKAVVSNGSVTSGTTHGFTNCFYLLREACSIKEAKEDESACPPETCEMCLVESDDDESSDDSDFSFEESDDDDGETEKKPAWDAVSVKSTCLELLSRSWARIVAAVKAKDMMRQPFVSLWTTLVSIHSNVPEKWARSFVAPLASVFTDLLSPSSSVSLWRAGLDTYNEALCYGSTIALLDEVPDEPLALSKLILNSLATFLPAVPAHSDFSGLVPSVTLEEPSVVISKSVLLVLKAAAIRTKAGEFFTSGEVALLDSWVKSKLPFHPSVEPADWVVRLMSSQDDVLVEALVCLLDIHCVSGDPKLSPHASFRALLSTLAFDSTVLLDYLVSDDTYFLLYLLRYLKHVVKSPRDFENGLGADFSNCVGVLRKLRESVGSLTQQRLFPYNVSPLLRVLDNCLNRVPEGNPEIS